MWEDWPDWRRSILRGSEKYSWISEEEPDFGENLNASQIGLCLILCRVENFQRFLSRGKKLRQLQNEQVKGKHHQNLVHN